MSRFKAGDRVRTTQLLKDFAIGRHDVPAGSEGTVTAVPGEDLTLYVRVNLDDFPPNTSLLGVPGYPLTPEELELIED